MAIYRDRVNYVDHDFNNTTLSIDSDHVAQGLQMIEIELDEDETDIQKVADGTGLFVTNPSRSGTIKFQILEASATNDKMWELRESNSSFPVSLLDTAAPNLNCRGSYCRIGKPPVVKRGKEADVVEWMCKCIYLDVKGGSYSLQS
jgi:hypothetical protein